METIQFKQKLTAFITKTQEEIDSLRVKAALGRMDAADVLNEMAKDMSQNLHVLAQELQRDGSAVASKASGYLEQLRLQATLGKAEAAKVYNERKEALRNSVSEMDTWLRNEGLALSPELRMRIQNELEKFKLKLDILRIRYELGKLEAREVMEEKRSRFKTELQEIVSSLKTDAELKKEEMGSKLSSAYEALRRSWN
ncbi:MAG: hypothetical protein ACK5C5_07405 [Bacteroidota bacterium]|jgi:hypothetical protein